MAGTLEPFDTPTLLRRHPYFESLSDDMLLKLLPYIRIRHFKKDEAIFGQGNHAGTFYLVTSGQVKIFKISPDGQEMTLHVFRANETLAEIAVFSGQHKYPANALCLEPTTVIAINGPAFQTFLLSHPSVHQTVLRILSERQVCFNTKIEDLAFRSVVQRLAKYLLLAQTEYENGAIHIDKKKELAALLATIPETLSRSFRALADKQLIAVAPHEVQILDRARLVAFAQ